MNIHFCTTKCLKMAVIQCVAIPISRYSSNGWHGLGHVRLSMGGTWLCASPTPQQQQGFFRFMRSMVDEGPLWLQVQPKLVAQLVGRRSQCSLTFNSYSPSRVGAVVRACTSEMSSGNSAPYQSSRPISHKNRHDSDRRAVLAQPLQLGSFTETPKEPQIHNATSHDGRALRISIIELFFLEKTFKCFYAMTLFVLELARSNRYKPKESYLLLITNL
jgi:hypothetical protein